jgi:hypothetical protein
MPTCWATKSTGVRLVSKHTSVSGQIAWNRLKRGSSYSATKAGMTVTVNTPPTAPSLSRSSPAARSSWRDHRVIGDDHHAARIQPRADHLSFHAIFFVKEI